MKPIYCTTYCNHGHYIHNGRPVNHECYVLPPAAIRAEMNGDYEEAIRILQQRKGPLVNGR